jgi:hypothetical protein
LYIDLGLRKPLNGCFAKKRERKNKVLTCVLIINHFSLNEDELELGTEVGGGFFFQCWAGIWFLNEHQLPVERFTTWLFQEVKRTASSRESTIEELEFI